jgi:sugar phosphate isomerase/epimerase
MQVGAMNHPKRDVLEEIRWMAELGMEFLDLTLEPPAASSWLVDPDRIREELERCGLDVVGHTAYYLPLGSPIEEVRCGAVKEFERCLEVFGLVGAKWMNIHPVAYAPMHERRTIVERTIRSLRELGDSCERTGVGLMIENLPGDFNTVDQIQPLMDALPSLGLHLDIGHCNLRTDVNTCEELVRAFGGRLVHAHLHDNKGGHQDLHLPLGVGTMDWRTHVRSLKESGYDGTITLEVFTEDTHFLEYSAKLLREAWSAF